MATDTRTMLSVGAAVVGLTLALVGCAQPATSGSTDGQTLVAENCGRCHPVERVSGAKKDRTAWTATIARMRAHGAELTDEQAQAIVDYLTQRDGGQ